MSKKPLTPAQRRAIARRQEQRLVANELQEIAVAIVERIPEGWRANVTSALYLIVNNGHLFTLAAGKAAALRGRYGPLQADLWPFVDAHNSEFAQAMRADDVARWNTPNFPELADGSR
jgi:hypothetical protein